MQMPFLFYPMVLIRKWKIVKMVFWVCLCTFLAVFNDPLHSFMTLWQCSVRVLYSTSFHLENFHPFSNPDKRILILFRFSHNLPHFFYPHWFGELMFPSNLELSCGSCLWANTNPLNNLQIRHLVLILNGVLCPIHLGR